MEKAKKVVAVYIDKQVVAYTQQVSEATGIPISRLAEDGLRVVGAARLKEHAQGNVALKDVKLS